MKRNGKADMALPDDTPYDRDQLARLRQLRKAVQRLPLMMFSPEYTTQGILPGMILYADYTFYTWTFRDVEAQTVQKDT